MKTLHKLLFLSAIIANTGCVSLLQLSKTLPPKIDIPEKECKFSFVNLYDYDTVSFNNKNKITVYRDGARNFIESLQESFARDRYYNLIVSDSLVKGRTASFLPKPVSIDSVLYFCRRKDTKYLLALESFRLWFDKDMEVVKNDDGSKTRTAHYSLVASAGLSLYDTLGKIIDRITISRDMPYQSREVLSGLLSVGPSMGGAGTEANNLAIDLGGDYIQRLYPGKMYVQRSFYVGKDFEQATPSMVSGDWEKARDELFRIFRTGKYRIRKRAAHNLSVVYEALGNDAEASRWADISNSKKLKDMNYFPD